MDTSHSHTCSYSKKVTTIMKLVVHVIAMDVHYCNGDHITMAAVSYLHNVDI